MEGNGIPTRRVVTGTNTQGKSYFVHDGPTPGTPSGGGAIDLNDIWVDDPANPDPTAARDPVDTETFHRDPPVNGSAIRVITWPPHYPEAGQDVGWHATPTIDYGIVLSGEMELSVDEGAVILRPGDVFVQRGANHAWRVPGNEPCTMAVIMIASPNYQ